jgi:hypothetical protein
MKDGRLAFVERNLHDATLVSAILTAPAFLSGLSDTEVGVIRGKIEERVSPEIVKARSDTAKALAETGQGWTRAHQADRGARRDRTGAEGSMMKSPSPCAALGRSWQRAMGEGGERAKHSAPGALLARRRVSENGPGHILDGQSARSYSGRCRWCRLLPQAKHSSLWSCAKVVENANRLVGRDLATV